MHAAFESEASLACMANFMMLL
ncbi:hypothetical protein ACCAA_350039 [Candidatus Accumulibacter aalborgensis]|uniref:Uncharacterized protein n=1 Tax=Candidatus Accumulibacter aalborgensis TaxID=1860102 RepID=A0A1A8XN82_9PROT|nr:hypothetical protein ACCAA_350039 [Candidatus Accumulibacter aalborgensis]